MGPRAAYDICYYDARCGLCVRSKRVLTALDWLGFLRFEDMNLAPDLPVPLDAAFLGMPMRTKGGRVLVGYPAIRRALMRTPLGALVAWLLYVPGVSWVGRRVYDWVARHRPRTSCKLSP
jgi:predicted DCC family thiol-disulfide oxidoreductase YuxK